MTCRIIEKTDQYIVLEECLLENSDIRKLKYLKTLMFERYKIRKINEECT